MNICVCVRVRVCVCVCVILIKVFITIPIILSITTLYHQFIAILPHRYSNILIFQSFMKHLLYFLKCEPSYRIQVIFFARLNIISQGSYRDWKMKLVEGKRCMECENLSKSPIIR